MPQIKWRDEDIAAALECVRQSATIADGLKLYADQSGHAIPMRSFMWSCQQRGIKPGDCTGGTAVQFARKFGRDVDAERAVSRAGWSPEHDMTHPVPTGFHVKGVSTYYGDDGKPKGQWVKSQVDREHELALLLDACKTLAEPFRAASPKVAPPKKNNADLLTVYPMGDPHIGMYSWAAETGVDFDLEIAEANLVAAVDHLVALAPPSEQAIVINLGDFYHSDNSANRTARSGNALDVDTRWAKVIRVGVRTMRRCIDRALAKHAVVRVINEIGNHDDHAALMLSLCLEQFYENNPRVEIDTSPARFHWHRFGACLLGVTHGDGVKADKLPGVMAHDRAKDWGETRHRYFYTGHVHHDSLREYPGCTVETFRTLASRDAWHHGAGYRSGRDMKCDVLHREHGRINRHIVGVEQLIGATNGQ